ncbi:MAG: hypothetical protein K8S97_13735 [Anaerolineae bacterium]|nr:hypothetical protein [Anaerolineae bacterium]
MLCGLRTGAWRNPRGIAVAAGAFMIGGAPWWVYNLRHDWAAFDFLVGGYEAGNDAGGLSLGDALIALLLLGFPTLYALRLPWEAEFASGIGVLVAAAIYLLLVTDLITSWKSHRRGRLKQKQCTDGNYEKTAPPPTPLPIQDGEGELWPAQVIYSPSPHVERGSGGEVKENPLEAARSWVWLVTGVFSVIFVISAFSDATGRYLMPLWVPATLGVALGLDRLRIRGWYVAAVALALLIAAHTGLVIRAATTETGLTPQLVDRLRTPPEYDAVLIDFLQAEGYMHGYASYWTAYRVTFRAGEDVILESTLPHEEKTIIGSGNRYTPYTAAVRAADRVVWITQDFPALDALIAARFAAQSIMYQTRDIGPYRVYYAFDAPVSPADIGLLDGLTLADL